VSLDKGKRSLSALVIKGVCLFKRGKKGRRRISEGINTTDRTEHNQPGCAHSCQRKNHFVQARRDYESVGEKREPAEGKKSTKRYVVYELAAQSSKAKCFLVVFELELRRLKKKEAPEKEKGKTGITLQKGLLRWQARGKTQITGPTS